MGRGVDLSCTYSITIWTMLCRNFYKKAAKREDYNKSLEPYDLNEPVDFHKSHLSGYLTERYDENDIDIVDRVNKCVKNNIHQALSQKIQGYATIDLKSINIQTCNSKVKYVLLPV